MVSQSVLLTTLLHTSDVHLMTQADTIHISMHSQRYDTLKIHLEQLPMWCDTIHPYYDAVRFDSMEIAFNASRPVS